MTLTTLTIKLLSSSEVTEHWPALRPMLQAACEGNEIASTEMSAEDIYILSQTDLCAVIAGFDGSNLACTIAIQFNETNGCKGADVIAMGGRRLMAFKSQFWQHIINWLRANEVQFLDAYSNPRLAGILMKKFGFTQSCVYMRMPL